MSTDATNTAPAAARPTAVTPVPTLPVQLYPPGVTGSRPLQFDPGDPAVLYYAGRSVNRSTNNGVIWSVISPDLTGGPGRDPNYPFGTVTTIAGARPIQSRFAGTDDGRLWFTTNLGTNWTRVTDSDVPGTWVTG